MSENKRKIQPITPEEAFEQNRAEIPDFVIEIVNELLAKRYSARGQTVTIRQDELVKLIMEKGDIPKEQESVVFEKRYLDFEDLYDKTGWDVSFNKPSIDNSYKAFFKFRPKKRHWINRYKAFFESKPKKRQWIDSCDV